MESYEDTIVSMEVKLTEMTTTYSELREEKLNQFGEQVSTLDTRLKWRQHKFEKECDELNKLDASEAQEVRDLAKQLRFLSLVKQIETVARYIMTLRYLI